ncbi:hypothetical protein BKA64DRAFT_93160 [Cadophora sp. MPI-SDFR-AT-0126]|nr:hypothetical protein BKA64DRAFT_93160 [Leotiomycetes sp. MPI-SDFR-AT-0126]
MVYEKTEPRLTGLWLSIPWLLEKDIVPAGYEGLSFSREQNASALIIDEEALEFAHSSYEPDFRSPEFSPFNCKSPNVGMPKVFVTVCGQDPLRDDGLIHEKVSREHGVETRLSAYLGVLHGHGMLSAFGASWKSIDKAKVESFRGWRWLLVWNSESPGDVILKTLASNERLI